MKQITYILLTIFALLLIVVFTLQNTGEVRIALFFWDIKTSLALLIFSLFSLGVIVTAFILTPAIITLKSTLRKEKRIISELRETNEECAEKETENKQ